MRTIPKPAPTAAAGLLVLARQRANLSQRALGRLAGVPGSMIAAYETGRRQPTLPTLQRLLLAAGFDLRLRLEPVDDHDASMQRAFVGMVDSDREQWVRSQKEFVDKARARVEVPR